MLAGAILLERVASQRTGDLRVVSIERQASVQIADDEDGDGGDTIETSPALDADHAQARLLASRGLLADALVRYAKVAEAHPESGRVQAEIGYWHLVAKHYELARDALAKAVTLAPNDPWATLKLGTVALRLDDDTRAEELYRRALLLRPHYGAAQLALGDLLARTKRPDEAIALLTKAASSGSNDDRARAHVALGRAYVGKKAFDDAGSAFAKAIEYAPAAVELRVGVARAWMQSGREEDLQRALVELQKAVELAPDVPQVYSALARLQEKKRDVSGAAANYERALHLDPTYAYARRRLIRLALDARDNERARGQAEELLRTAPDEPEHHFLAGLVASRIGRADDARTHYRDAIARAKGDYPEAYFNLGILEKNQNNPDAAIAAYQKAIELRPSYQQAWNNLGLIHGAAKKYADAEAAFHKAIEINGQYATAWLNLGQLYRDQDRDADALAAFDRAIAAKPGYSEARLDRAVALGRLHRNNEAIAVYQLLVTEQPRYVAAWYNLGVALHDAGDLVGARAALERASTLDPEHLPSLRKLGEVAALAGDGAAAQRAFEEVLDHAPSDRATRLALADQQRKQGDLSACARQARAVLSTEPQDRRASELLHACTNQ